MCSYSNIFKFLLFEFAEVSIITQRCTHSILTDFTQLKLRNIYVVIGLIIDKPTITSIKCLQVNKKGPNNYVEILKRSSN